MLQVKNAHPPHKNMNSWNEAHSTEYESNSEFGEGDKDYFFGIKNVKADSAFFDENDIERNPKLKELLQCKSCKEVATTPIFLCQDGHNLCGKCHKTLPSCPCKLPLSQIRNRMAEELISCVELKCRYHEQGCSEICFGSNLIAHLNECEFRPISCFFPNCDLEIPFGSFLPHIENFHKVEGHEGRIFHNTITSSLNPDNDICTFTPGFIRAYGHKFLCMMQTFPNCFLCWASLLGANADAKDYFTKITLIHPVNKKRQTSWVGPVHDFRKKPEEIFETGHYLGLIIGPFKEFIEKVVEEDGEELVSFNCQFAVYSRNRSGKKLYLKQTREDMLNRNSPEVENLLETSGEGFLDTISSSLLLEDVDSVEEFAGLDKSMKFLVNGQTVDRSQELPQGDQMGMTTTTKTNSIRRRLVQSMSNLFSKRGNSSNANSNNISK